MASKDDNYKEGVDFEWRSVKGKDGKVLHKTRHFFSKAEKTATKTPAPTATKKTPTAKPSTKREATVAKSAKVPNVVTTKLDISDFKKRTVAAIDRATAKPAKPAVKMPERPISPTRSKSATGRYSNYETARLGNITEAQWDKMTKQQREAKGLPVSWMDYVRSGGDSAVKKTAGFAKGGMVKRKGC